MPEPDRLTLDQILRKAGLPRAKVAMETTSITFLKSTLARTDYLSYLTRPSVAWFVHP
ncbi:hypothetical protein IB235_23360 [Paracoccus sp. PAR01]|nr:hypothetical protein [Paracoccus sp. PAR01]